MTTITNRNSTAAHAIKKIIGIIAVFIVAALGYYGSYLPLRKSKLFIVALQRAGSIRSFAELQETFATPLATPSPIGQEELVRNLASTVLGLMSQDATSPELTEKLLEYVQDYYDPIVSRGKGMSFSQNHYLLGIMNEIAFVKTNELSYINQAKKYFTAGHERGPTRPQSLYGLFDVYRALGEVEAAKAIGEQILDQWPDDERTREILGDFLQKQETK